MNISMLEKHMAMLQTLKKKQGNLRRDCVEAGSGRPGHLL